MEKRELGRTGEKIPVVGMGTWQIGDAKNEGRATELKAIRRGVELGMTLIDTAEMYGHGRSETLVGEAIKGLGDDVFVATKVSPEHFGYDQVKRSCESSLKRLGLRQIDLYQLHWPSDRVPIGETMRAMEELVSEGKIRYVGVSNFSVAEMREAREALPRSEVASNQVRYSLTHRSIESEVLPFCEKERISVIAYSPLDTGRLPADRIPGTLLDKYGLTPAQMMLNWATWRDGVVAIPKASSLEHVEENAGSCATRISAADYQSLSKAFRS